MPIFKISTIFNFGFERRRQHRMDSQNSVFLNNAIHLTHHADLSEANLLAIYQTLCYKLSKFIKSVRCLSHSN